MHISICQLLHVFDKNNNNKSLREREKERKRERRELLNPLIFHFKS